MQYEGALPIPEEFLEEHQGDRIEAVITVDFFDMCGIDWLNDLAEDQLLGPAGYMLSDIEYVLTGVTDDGCVRVRVSAMLD